MPSIEVHGAPKGGESSPIPGTKYNKINNNLQKMTDEAAQAAMQSAIPWASDQFKKINTNLGRLMEREAARAAAAAKDSLSSSIPYMNKTVLRFNTNLAKQIEKQARDDYQARQREIAQDARLAKQASALRQRQDRAAFGQAYTAAHAENRLRDQQDPARYQIGNVNRLGRQGQFGIEQGRWREMAAAERELARIEKQNGANPQVKAAVAAARQRMGAARAGQSPMRLRLGRALGRMQDGRILGPLLEASGVGGLAEEALINPLTALGAAGVAVGKQIVTAPWTIANMSRGVMAGAAPYMNMRSGLAGMGRAGGFDSMELERMLRSDDPALNRLGLGPARSAQLLSSYGIAPTSAGGAVGILKALGGAENLPALGGLGLDRYAEMGRSAVGMGLASNNQAGLNEYFKRLQAVTSVAVASGMDRSTAVGNLDQLLRMAAGSGANVGSGKDIAEMAARMGTGGLAADRMGVSAQSMQSAADTFGSKVGVGGDPTHVGIMGSYISTHGGLKAFEDPNNAALIKIIGQDRYDKLKSTRSGRIQLRDIHDAAASGNALIFQDALGAVVNGNVGAMTTIANGSYLNNIGGYQGVLAKQRFIGATPQAYASYRATLGAPTSDPRYLGNVPGKPGRFAGLDAHYGLPAGALAGIEGLESSGGTNVKTSSAGAMGPFQFLPSTWAEFAKPGENIMNEKDASKVAGRYLRSLSKQFNGDFDETYGSYNAGPGRVSGLVKQYGNDWLAHAPQETQNYVARMHAAVSAADELRTNGPNSVAGQNTAKSRNDLLQMNPSGVASDLAVQLANGASGDALMAASNKTTGWDSAGVGGLVHSADVVITSLEGLGAAVDKLARRIDQVVGDGKGPVHDPSHIGPFFMPPPPPALGQRAPGKM